MRPLGSSLRASLAVALLGAALGAVLTACPSKETTVVELCPDPDRMYRDYTKEGDPCLCEDPDHYVLNTDGSRCILCAGSCDGKKCGEDGCGRLAGCGDCPMGYVCDPALFECVQCKSDCSDRSCGDDGCGHSCGTCAEGSTCEEGTCTSSSGGVQPASACCTPYGACPLVQALPSGYPCYCAGPGGYVYGAAC